MRTLGGWSFAMVGALAALAAAPAHAVDVQAGPIFSNMDAQGRGGCSGCSVQCAPGQRASYREGSPWNDKLNNGDQGCVTATQCTCN